MFSPWWTLETNGSNWTISLNFPWSQVFLQYIWIMKIDFLCINANYLVTDFFYVFFLTHECIWAWVALVLRLLSQSRALLVMGSWRISSEADFLSYESEVCEMEETAAIHCPSCSCPDWHSVIWSTSSIFYTCVCLHAMFSFLASHFTVHLLSI